jgi:hypothetical protein
MFMNVGYIGVESGSIPVNFSSQTFFKSSPVMHIMVNRLVPTHFKKFTDGCPVIQSFTLNDKEKKWEQSSKPAREPAADRLDWCSYTLQTQHFSKFAVGGIKQTSSSISER